MDPEKQTRKELIAKLGGSFDCIEEAWLSTERGEIRCDVLARPSHPDFQQYLFAFECKIPTKEWHYSNWARTLKQAIDYVGAKPIKNSISLGVPDGLVTCAFVFPAPEGRSSNGIWEPSEYVRDGFESEIAGMFHLALMFRCGRAGLTRLTNIQYFGLSLGPQSVWSDRFGFQNKSHDLLREGRPFGSKNKK